MGNRRRILVIRLHIAFVCHHSHCRMYFVPFFKLNRRKNKGNSAENEKHYCTSLLSVKSNSKENSKTENPLCETEELQGGVGEEIYPLKWTVVAVAVGEVQSHHSFWKTTPWRDQKRMSKIEIHLLLLLLTFTSILFAGGRLGTGLHHFQSCTSTAKALNFGQL